MRIPGYEIKSKIGEGGFGVVYEALELEGERRRVAIKLLKEEGDHDLPFEELLGRFRREAAIITKLDHPHMVSLLASGEVEGQHYVVMTFAPGKDLETIRGEYEGPVPRDLVRKVMYQTLQALDYAHRSGVVHRDLKPGNIMVEQSDDVFVRVMDFGLARLRAKGEDGGLGLSGSWVMLTSSGEVLGTEQYMSPEQKYAPSSVDHRSDLYSWALVYVELLYSRAGAENLIVRHMLGAKPALPDDVDPEEAEFLYGCLSAQAAHRPEAAAILKVLSHLTGDVSYMSALLYRWRARARMKWAYLREKPIRLVLFVWMVILCLVGVVLSVWLLLP